MGYRRWSWISGVLLFVFWTILAFYDGVLQAIWFEASNPSYPIYAWAMVVPVFVARWLSSNYSILVIFSATIFLLAWAIDGSKEDRERDRVILGHRLPQNRLSGKP